MFLFSFPKAMPTPGNDPDPDITIKKEEPDPDHDEDFTAQRLNRNEPIRLPDPADDEGVEDVFNEHESVADFFDDPNEPVKTLDARHGKESAWISCKLQPRCLHLDNVLVNFKPVNEFDNTKRLRIFAHLNHREEIEICVQNLGDLKLELSMEVYLWNRRFDETQTVGSIQSKVEANESKIVATFRLDQQRVQCGSFHEGLDLRIHFKPHF